MATVCDVNSGKKYFLKDISYHPIANYYTYTTDGATSRMLCSELKVTHWMPYPEPADDILYENVKCCASCGHLQFLECPYPHFFCEENKECPCQCDEVPDTDFFCEKYKSKED